MKTYTGFTFTSKIEHIIKNTKNNNQQVVIISSQPKYLQQAYLKHHDAILLVDFYTMLEYQNYLIEMSNIYRKPLTKVAKYEYLKQVLQNTTNEYFSKDTSLATINELLSLFDEFVHLSNDSFLNIKDKKVLACYNIYQEFLHIIDNNYYFHPLQLIDVIKYPKNIQYYIISDVFNDEDFHFINELDKNNDVTVLVNYDVGSMAFEQIYQKYITTTNKIDVSNALTKAIFSEEKISEKVSLPIHIIKQTTPQAEVDSVVSHMYKTMIDENLQFSDFACYYPNNQYASMLQDSMQQFSIAYNTVSIEMCRSHKIIQTFIQFLKSPNHDNFLNVVASESIKNIHSHNINRIKKSWYENHNITDEQYTMAYNTCYEQYIKPLLLVTSYKEVSILLKQAIQETLYIENKEIFLTFLDSLPITTNVSLDEVFEYIKENLPNTNTISMPPIDHVYLLSTAEPFAGILQAKHVYILGNNESIFPTKPSNTGLLLDIHRKNILGIDNAYSRLCKEQSNIISICSYLPTSLTFSLATASSSGQTLLESSMLQLIKQAIEVTNISTDDIPLLSLLPMYKTNCIETKNIITSFTQSKNQPPQVTLPIVNKQLSVSKLESYNACPYRYFYNYCINLYPYNTPLLQANEIGNLIHHILEHFMYLFKSKNDIQPLIQASIDKEIDNYLNNPDNHLIEKMQHNKNKLLLRSIKRDIYKAIQVLQSQISKSMFTINNTEMRVDQAYPKYKIAGYVDRIDRYNDFISVIDYKSGVKELDLDLARLGFNIQMLLYMDILLKKEDAKLGGVLYFSTKNRVIKVSGKKNPFDEETILSNYQMQGYANSEIVEDIDTTIDVGSSSVIKAKFVKSKGTYKGAIIEVDEYNEIIEDIYNHIDHLHEEMTSGNISISPKGSNDQAIHAKVNPCSYCNYKALCRFDIFYNEYDLIQKGGEDNG